MLIGDFFSRCEAGSECFRINRPIVGILITLKEIEMQISELEYEAELIELNNVEIEEVSGGCAGTFPPGDGAGASSNCGTSHV